MPIYEYHCNNCQRKVEILVRSSSTSPNCPRCGSSDLSRLFSAFAIHSRESFETVYTDMLSNSKMKEGLQRKDPSALAEWNRRMSHTSDAYVPPNSEEMYNAMDELYPQDMGEDQSME